MANYVNDSLFRADYLNKVVSLPIPASLHAQDFVLSAGPSQGEYWIPKSVRIAIASDTVLQNTGGFTVTPPLAQLYLGAPQAMGVRNNNSAFNMVDPTGMLIDQTLNGFRDVTGVVSGMIISPGENLYVAWRDITAAYDPVGNLIPSAAYMQVLGITTNQPPSVATQFLPDTIGPGFRNAPDYNQTPPPTTVQSFWFGNPGHGNTVTINTLLDGSSTRGIVLHTMTWTWHAATGVDTATFAGSWLLSNTQNPAGATRLMFDNFVGGGRYMDWKGLTIVEPAGGTGPGGNPGTVVLEFNQNNLDTANTSYCGGTLVYSPYYGS